MKLSTTSTNSILLALQLANTLQSIAQVQSTHSSTHTRQILLDRCCQVGREKAMESSKFNCKLSAREALVGRTSSGQLARANLLTLSLSADNLLARDSNFADQCEMLLESCCLSHHRAKNCDSGKQLAKSGASCMDVELSKEATMATESFNDCCMSCSLGMLAAKNPSQNESASGPEGRLSRPVNLNLANRCKLISPLAASLSGQLYEQTYNECCLENLPRLSGALVEPGAPIDCANSNPCSQRCISGAQARLRGFESSDRCDCFAGYKLAPDGVNCIDIDECKLGQHTCNRKSEVCDNTRGSFRCLARQSGELAELGAAFAPLRLCPLGSRWTEEEQECRPFASAGSAQGQRSASLTMEEK